MNKKIKSNALIIFFYSIFTVIMTYPIAFRITALSGPPGDNLMFAWNMWWFKKALIDLHISPLQTGYIFYPQTISMIYHTLCPFNSFISIPLQYIFNLAVVYNLMLLSTFLFSALGTYLLAYYFTKNKLASFIAGLIFAFCPYHFAHAECHLNHATMQFLPFSILYLAKLLDYPRIKYSITGGIFLALNFYSCYYYSVYIFIFFTVFLLYWLLIDVFNWRKGEKRVLKVRFILCFAVMILIYIIGILPLLYGFVVEGQGGKYAYGGQEGYVADLAGLFVPSLQHSVFRNFKWTNFICSKFTGCLPEYTVFLGYTTLFLAIFAICKAKFKWKIFWTVISIFFILLSLGPHLHILGKTYLGKINLPYYWLIQKVPLFNQARCPSRLIVIAMLSLSVLAAYGALYILGKFKQRRWKLVCFSILCFGVLFEFSTIPLRQTKVEIPDFYSQLKKDKKDYTILDFPIFMCDSNQELYMYFQAIHEKKIVNGWISRLPPNLGKVLDDVAKLSVKNLQKYNIKYIIVHKNLIDGARNLGEFFRIKLLEGDLQKYIYDLLEITHRFKKMPGENKDCVVYEIDEGRGTDTEIIEVYNNKGGKFNLDEDGEYIISVKIDNKWAPNKVKKYGFTLEFNNKNDLDKWNFKFNNTSCKFSIDEKDGLRMPIFFDGIGEEDEFVQMTLSDINIDLKECPIFYLVYKVEDSRIQTVEIVAGIDFDEDGKVDEHIRGIYPYPANEEVSKYEVNLMGKIKNKLPEGSHPKIIFLELYPHKIWGRDCSVYENRGEYNYWIKEIGFYGETYIKGRDVITDVKDMKVKDWISDYYGEGYKEKKRRNSIVVYKTYPYLELYKYFDSNILEKYNFLDVRFKMINISILKSMQVTIKLDIDGDGIPERQIFEEVKYLNRHFNRYIFDIGEAMKKAKLCDIAGSCTASLALKFNLRKNIDYGHKLMQSMSVKLLSKRIKITDTNIFKKPVFELDGRIYVIPVRYELNKNEGGILLSKQVELNTGPHDIKNVFGKNLNYIVIEKIVDYEK